MFRRVLWMVLLIGCFTAIVILDMACSSTTENQQGNTLLPTATPSPAADPIKIDVKDLMAEYEKNDITANAKYKGKQLEVSGTVFGFGSDLFGNPTLFFAVNESDTIGLIATFGKDKIDTLTAISKGQRVTVRGQGDGLRIHVQIKYASIVK